MSHRKSDLGIPCPRKICQSSASKSARAKRPAISFVVRSLIGSSRRKAPARLTNRGLSVPRKLGGSTQGRAQPVSVPWGNYITAKRVLSAIRLRFGPHQGGSVDFALSVLIPTASHLCAATNPAARQDRSGQSVPT